MKKRGKKEQKPMPVNALERARALASEKQRTGQVTASGERLAQIDPEAIETLPPMPGHRAGQRLLAAPLDRLQREGRITTREFLAGDRYRREAHEAKVDAGPPGVDFGSVGGGNQSRVPVMFASQAVADARVRWRETERAIRGVVRSVADMGLLQERGLIDIGRNVFGIGDEKLARAAGFAGFRVMLGALSDWYET